MRLYSALAIILLQSIYGCCANIGLENAVRPKSFKLLIPFEMNTRGIVVDTYWGANKTNNKLLWDNNSPTWVNDKVISNDKSISKSKIFFYSTTTADGTAIKGNVYRCDSISLGHASFVNVPFYKISDQMNGAFGENLISKGVWEINFTTNEMIFTSSADSLKDVAQAEIFPTDFTSNGIKTLVNFPNNKTEYLEIDFGFNGGILLPSIDFTQISNGNKHVYKSSLQFSTPGSEHIVENTHVLDTIRIKENKFTTVITTNKLAKENLIGLLFFKQFEFVIFDYKNKLFYVSKNRR